MTIHFIALPSFSSNKANTEILGLDETGYTSSEDDNSRSGHYQSIKHVAHQPPPRPTTNKRQGNLKPGQIISPQDNSDNSLNPAVLHYTPGRGIYLHDGFSLK